MDRLVQYGRSSPREDIMLRLRRDLETEDRDASPEEVSAIIVSKVSASIEEAIAEAKKQGKEPAAALGALHQETDGYWSSMVKLVPAETVSAYLALVGLLSQAPAGADVAHWIVFGVLVSVTPFYIYLQLRKHTRFVPFTQIFLTTMVFVTWAYTIGGPFTQLVWYDAYWGSLGILVLTFIGPLVLRMARSNYLDAETQAKQRAARKAEAEAAQQAAKLAKAQEASSLEA